MIQEFLHGGAADLMRKVFPSAPEPWIDLSTGVNPWAYPTAGLDVSNLRRLPTANAYAACRSAMALTFGAPEEAVLVGPGSELLIRLLPTVIAPRHVAILSPAYGTHADVWTAADCQVTAVDRPLDVSSEVDVLVLCNPGYADGKLYAPETLERLRSRLATRNGWLIVDEAYADLNPQASLAPRGGSDGLIVLRSAGKFFGLPGARLGALIAPPQIRAAMVERLGAWPVSSLALCIGRQAYSDLGWQMETRRRLGRACRRLDRILSDAGFASACGTSLYRVIETPSATKTWSRLARRGIYVRRFPWTEHRLRIGLPPDPEAADRLMRAFTP